MLMKAHVLGVEHAVQLHDHTGDLNRLIRSTLSKKAFSLIAEEWSWNKHEITVGHRVAGELGLEWLNMEMTEDQQEAAGILNMLKKRRPDFDEMAGRIIYEIDPLTRLPKEDGIREDYWVEQILNARTSGDVFVMCGMLHLPHFTKRLRATGFEASEDCICEHDWYFAQSKSICEGVRNARKNVTS
jgi:hypothetical protein